MKKYSGLNYAFYEFIYALCRNGGKLESSDNKKLFTILSEEFKDNQELVLYVLKKESMDVKIAHLWILREITQNSDFFNPENKRKFDRSIRKILMAFPKLSPSMKKLAEDFLLELELVKY